MNRRQSSVAALVAALWTLAAVSDIGMRKRSRAVPPSDELMVPRVLWEKGATRSNKACFYVILLVSDID